jgi:hypothetical protein
MMNTIMEEKIKQAFQEWKQTEQPKEKVMNEDMNEDVSNNRKLSNVLMDKIKDNPGITGKELRTYVAQGFPSTPISYVPALLKGFYDSNFVSRVPVAPLAGSRGGGTYAYTFIPENIRAKMPKREKVKAYTKKKTKAVHAPKEDKGISALVPIERKPVHPLDIGPATLHITISTSQGAYSMKLEEAKFIYTQLNQIFGGAR